MILRGRQKSGEVGELLADRFSRAFVKGLSFRSVVETLRTVGPRVASQLFSKLTLASRGGLANMIGLLCFYWTACIGQIPAATTKPQANAIAAKSEETKALACYNARKIKTPHTADGHWKLGLWCEKNGLAAEAADQFAEVVKLDRNRLNAWKKLGYRHVGGRWVSEDRLQEDREQCAADRVWVPKLIKLHKAMHRPKTRVEAEKTLANVDDPKAVPAIYTVFGSARPHHQLIAVQLLGQIRAPKATLGLTALAVYSGSAEVRHRATSTLRDRDLKEFIPALAGLLVQPLKFTVRPVAGPGSPGILEVEGEDYNVRRFYAPPPPPLVRLQPGDIVGYNALGMPVITRPLETLDSMQGSMNIGSQRSDFTVDLNSAIRLDLGRNLIEARRAASSAEAQLESDVRQIQCLNVARSMFKEHVLSILRDSTGKNEGDAAEKWNALIAEARGYEKDAPQPSRPKKTLDQLVPLAFNPQFGDLVAYTSMTIVPDI